MRAARCEREPSRSHPPAPEATTRNSPGHVSSAQCEPVMAIVTYSSQKRMANGSVRSPATSKCSRLRVQSISVMSRDPTRRSALCSGDRVRGACCALVLDRESNARYGAHGPTILHMLWSASENFPFRNRLRSRPTRRKPTDRIPTRRSSGTRECRSEFSRRLRVARLTSPVSPGAAG